MAFVVLMGAAVEVSAQFGTPVDVTPVVAAPAWKTEVIQFEPHGLYFRQATEDPEPSRAWERFRRLPAADATEREVVTHIQKQTTAAKRLLNNSGFSLPTGTAILWDEDTGTLAVRSTHEAVEWLRSLGSENRQKLERNVSSTLRVVQAEGAVLREIARETTMQFDQASAWKGLETLVAEGKATYVQTLTLNTKSGMRGNAQIGSRNERIESVVVDERGVVRVDKEEGFVGTLFETEPVVWLYGDRFHVNLAMQHHFAASTIRDVNVGKVLSREVTLPVTDDYDARINTSFAGRSGSHILIGVWKPTASADLAGQDVLQAAFLETHVVLNLPEVNSRALPLLLAHMDKAEPVPVSAEKPAKPPAGMKTIRLSVPPDFLSVSDVSETQAAPADPFQVSTDEKEKKPVLRTALAVLKEQGIPFPEGAVALHDPGDRTLTVTNTPENLELVESFFSSLCGAGTPVNIQFDIEILEADAPLIRAIATEASKIADHSKLLERLDQATRPGQTRHIGFMRGVTVSGQKTATQTGTFYSSGASAEPVTEKQEAPKVAGDVAGQNKPGSEVNANPRPGEKAPINVTAEGQFVGTRMELLGLISPDGVTLKMDLALDHHYAPPTPATNKVKSAAPDIAVTHEERSSETFHFASVTSLFTMRSGTTRIVGLWKPEGSPEHDGKDVMQVAFVRAAITRAE